jgi:putative ABC transport system permease protein
MTSLLADVRFGLRILWRSPAFAAVAVLTLALGTGVNTAMFGALNAVVLRPLPCADPERVVVIEGRYEGRSSGAGDTSRPDYEDWRRDAQGFAGMAAASGWTFNLTGRPEPLRLEGARVSGDFFSILGVRARLGRLVAPADDEPGSPPVAVLGHDAWQRAFGGDAAVLGRVVILNGIAHTVVGVLPPGFVVPGLDHELWAPLANELTGAPRDARFLVTFGRLAEGVSLAQAQASLDVVTGRLAAEHPDTNRGWGGRVVPAHESLVGDVRPALLLLAAAVGVVLLIACANVSNLLLARAAARRREVALRAALGASTARLARQFLAENLVLASVSSALGLALARALLPVLRALAPGDVPRLDQARLDPAVLGFTLVVALATGAGLALVPVLQARRCELLPALREGDRGGSAALRSPLRRGLVVLETALALTLLVGGGLLVRSLRNVLAVPPGFDAARVAGASVFLAPPRYRDLASQRAFVRDVLAAVETLPGVERAATVSRLPLEGGAFMLKFQIEGRDVGRAEAAAASYRVVSSGYFQAMGIPVLEGRAPARTDSETSPPVVIVNRTFARRFWPGESPVGRRIRWIPEDDPAAPPRWHTIVGVVGDVRSAGLAEEEGPAAYVPFSQRVLPFVRDVSVVARAATDPGALLPSLRRALLAVDPDLPVYRARTLETVVSGSVETRRFNAALLEAFALLAFTLSMIGIYGVLSYTVGLRTREIGVRVALGASPAAVRRLVLKDGLGLAARGLALGLPLAMASSRLLEGMLFAVGPADPATLAVVSAAVFAAAALACHVPARRATRVDPTVALRHE